MILTDGDVVFQPRKIRRSGPAAIATYPAADFSIESIGDLLGVDIRDLLAAEEEL